MHDELEPWDEAFVTTAPDETMRPLQQLQQYQHAIRKITPFLDAYEGIVLLQIIDRIIGWRRSAAVFRAEVLYGGDTHYGGLSRSMHRSKFMKVLRSLENKGLIHRQMRSNSREAKIYRVNLNVDLEQLSLSARPVSRSAMRAGTREILVSGGDEPVQQADGLVSSGAILVSSKDTIEVHPGNNIGECNEYNSTRLVPPAQGARDIDPDCIEAKSDGDLARAEINPRRRSR